MGLGLLILVSVGKENIYLSSQPEITFFKMAYKRHTNFSQEPTPQYFKTTPDFNRKCTVNIGKNADLLGMTYLYVELPDIQLDINSIPLKKFAWVEKIGLALINFIEIEVGGKIVDRHYGDWLNIWHEMTISMGIKKSYNKMIGNISELTSYTENKTRYILYIPLSFWFCLESGLSLPLISLTHNDVKIHVDFNDVDKCYKISPNNYITINENYCLYEPYEKITQIYENNKNIGEFIFFDKINQRIYYNQIKGTFIIPTKNNDPNYKIIGEITNYETNIKSLSVVVKEDSYFKFNKPTLNRSYLIVNYIYLDNFERTQFINNTHQYIIPVIQNLPEQISYSTNIIYKLPLFNPIKLIIWRTILLSNLKSQNIFNYSTFPFTYNSQDIINKSLVVINSINRMDINSIQYYTIIQKYQNYIINSQKGIYMYSFSLNPLDINPSGTLNFSQLDDAYLKLTLNNIINYQNPISIKAYGIQYNLFRISNGIGGLGFDL